MRVNTSPPSMQAENSINHVLDGSRNTREAYLGNVNLGEIASKYERLGGDPGFDTTHTDSVARVLACSLQLPSNILYGNQYRAVLLLSVQPHGLYLTSTSPFCSGKPSDCPTASVPWLGKQATAHVNLYQRNNIWQASYRVLATSRVVSLEVPCMHKARAPDISSDRVIHTVGQRASDRSIRCWQVHGVVSRTAVDRQPLRTDQEDS